ncbi:MAG TPA: ATP-binding protein [Armatimonadota bacterium]|nr:ATP-binding protein [Armatimonadota bacterium]
MELVIFTGLQGSGKSTFYRTMFVETHQIVSKDLMKNVRKKNIREQQLISEALAEGRSVVVDNTNPTPEDRIPLIELGHQYHALVIGYYFESRVKDCLERNSWREGRARVPDVAIYATIKKLRPPSFREGFDQLFFVHIDRKRGYIITPWRESSTHIA